MSGGSFDYLYGKFGSDVVPLMNSYREMLEQLKTYGEDGRCAREDMEMLYNCCRLAASLHTRLSDVMHDVEWHVSCDYGEDQVRAGLRKYAEKNK